MADSFETVSRSLSSRPLLLFLYALLVGKAVETPMLEGKAPMLMNYARYLKAAITVASLTT